MKLTDFEGKRLVLFGSQGESDECYEVDPVRVVSILTRYFGMTEDEVVAMLRKSDIDNPVTYHDETFWVE